MGGIGLQPLFGKHGYQSGREAECQCSKPESINPLHLRDGSWRFRLRNDGAVLHSDELFQKRVRYRTSVRNEELERLNDEGRQNRGEETSLGWTIKSDVMKLGRVYLQTPGARRCIDCIPRPRIRRISQPRQDKLAKCGHVPILLRPVHLLGMMDPFLHVKLEILFLKAR